MKIAFASLNEGKIQELQKYLERFPIELISMNNFNILEIPENSLTFVENAINKARAVAKITNLPTIADDSGLIVPALKGAPGIYSARYAGNKVTAAENIKKLLQELIDVPAEKRNAFFYCVIVYLRDPCDPIPIICDSTWEGHILRKSQGNNGFGYDPIFFDPIVNLSAGEMSLEMKNKISHRGKALAKLAKYFEEQNA